jgi:hypothetical protein
MQEVEEQVNEQARAARITPPEVQLIFTMDKQADIRCYNMLIANEVSAVMVLNADGSVPENIMVVHPRISSSIASQLLTSL